MGPSEGERRGGLHSRGAREAGEPFQLAQWTVGHVERVRQSVRGVVARASRALLVFRDEARASTLSASVALLSLLQCTLRRSLTEL